MTSGPQDELQMEVRVIQSGWMRSKWLGLVLFMGAETLQTGWNMLIVSVKGYESCNSLKMRNLKGMKRNRSRKWAEQRIPTSWFVHCFNVATWQLRSIAGKQCTSIYEYDKTHRSHIIIIIFLKYNIMSGNWVFFSSVLSNASNSN